MNSEAAALKSAFRAEVRARRRAMTQEARSTARAALTERLRDLVTESGAKRVACYSPRGDEPDTSGFLDWALASGVEVLLPISRADRQLDWALADGRATVVGRHGIAEPDGERLPPQAIETAELLFIPACAVAPDGTRLGWGLGYFDRALANVDPNTGVFAVVFSEDVLPALPAERHDAPITGAVTPERVITFPAGTG